MDVRIAPETLVPRLGELLIERGLLEPDDLQTALDFQHDRITSGVPCLIGQALVELGRGEESAPESALESALEAAIERKKAAGVVTEMAEHIGDEELKKAFLSSPSFSHLPLEVESGG